MMAEGDEDMKIYTLSTGDDVYRYYKSIVILFKEKRKVLSTSLQNGGYREDLTSVFNEDCNPGAGLACTLKAPTHEEHLRLIADELGIEPDFSSGISTAASMKNVAIQRESYEGLTVTAIVTGGIEVNGGRVGDPTTHYKPIEKETLKKPGTINIMLVIDGDLPEGTMVRAVVTCTEAKTAALQELMAGSNYSQGLATGSGTDSTIIITNPTSPLYFENVGKHSKVGELIGIAVKKAVKEALKLQTGLSPDDQHRVLRRLKRFGTNEESLWQCYKDQGTIKVSKAQFIDYISQIDRNSAMITYTSLYVHLLDQLAWQLLSLQEVKEAGNDLLELACKVTHIVNKPLAQVDKPEMILVWQDMLIRSIQKKFDC